MTRKRILYIHHGGGLGGAPLSLLFLLQQLDRRTYDPIVLCIKKDAPRGLYEKEGIRTYVDRRIFDFSHTNLQWRDPLSLRGFIRMIFETIAFLPSVLETACVVQKLKPDLVHLNSSSLAPSAMGAKLAGVPVVWHIREPLHRGYFGLRRRFVQWCIRRFGDRVIAISRNDAGQLIDDGSIRIVYNFVDFKRFDRTLSGEAFREEFDLGETKAVGMLGGVSEPKGTLEFVQALKFVRARIPNVKFFVVGKYPQASSRKDRLREKVAEIVGERDYWRDIREVIRCDGLKEHLIFTGVRDDIPRILSGLDVLVFPSTKPHFARPIIEAEAMGKPVVASNLGGPDELVEDGVTGKLVTAGDTEALAEGIVEILKDEERAKRMGEAGYRRARRLFDAQKNAAATFAVYEELVSGEW